MMRRAGDYRNGLPPATTRRRRSWRWPGAATMAATPGGMRCCRRAAAGWTRCCRWASRAAWRRLPRCTPSRRWRQRAVQLGSGAWLRAGAGWVVWHWPVPALAGLRPAHGRAAERPGLPDSGAGLPVRPGCAGSLASLRGGARRRHAELYLPQTGFGHTGDGRDYCGDIRIASLACPRRDAHHRPIAAS